MITLILDGYNVAHAVPELARQMDQSLQAAREALVRLCEAYRARRGDIGKLYVVFEGRDDSGFGPRAQPRGGVTVLFTQEGEEADRRILKLIESERGRGHCLVVSNDNEVANNARAFGARVISAQEFYRQARPVSGSRPHPAAGSDKATPSARDAQQITEDYRKHLEDKSKGAPVP
ncbi:MAG: NYN domain-containing protein [Candidatus Omnitrophica bacterium]|nr:NYN domain-containing protein [Candidatus Omnitrophota bacterium]